MKKLVLLSLISAGLLLTQVPAVESEKDNLNFNTCDEVEKHRRVALSAEDNKPDFVIIKEKNVGTNFY